MSTELLVDPVAVAANWRLLDSMHAGETGAVVKADAYGLGADRIAPALAAAGARTFFVGHPEEGAALRPLLPPEAVICVLNGFWPDSFLYHEHGLAPALSTIAEIGAWQAAARARGRKLPCFLHVDTGMNRLGLPLREFEHLAGDPAQIDDLDVLALLTHLASAEDETDPANEIQRARFAAARARLPHLRTSMANSSGLFLGETYATDLARPGAALYGINPTPHAPNPMQPTFRLRARVLQVRDIETGERVGYNGTWQARRPTSVATVACGYADGFLRALSNRGEAVFDGERIPLIGRVSMDLATFDVTDHRRVVPGSWLTLIGPELPAEEVAARAGTSAYEILTALGPRYTRRFDTLWPTF